MSFGVSLQEGLDQGTAALEVMDRLSKFGFKLWGFLEEGVVGFLAYVVTCVSSCVYSQLRKGKEGELERDCQLETN